MFFDTIKKTEEGEFYLISRDNWDEYADEADTLRKIVSKLQSLISRRLAKDVIDVEELFKKYSIIAETDNKRDFFDVNYDNDNKVCTLISVFSGDEIEFNIKLPDLQRRYKLTEYKLADENEIHGVFTSESELLDKAANIIAKRVADEDVKSYCDAFNLLKLETNDEYDGVYMDIEGKREIDIFPTLYLYDEDNKIIDSIFMRNIVRQYINLNGIEATITDKHNRHYGSKCKLFPVDYSGWVVPNDCLDCAYYVDLQRREYHDKDFDADDRSLDTYEN